MKLQYLDLSGNHMNFISIDSFFGLKNLIHLDLSDNWFVHVTPDSFDELAFNTSIDISVNPLICDCAQQSFVSWLRLQRSRNEFKTSITRYLGNLLIRENFHTHLKSFKCGAITVYGRWRRKVKRKSIFSPHFFGGRLNYSK